MYSVHPNDTERFALRTLLLYSKGAESFDDLLTVDGIKCSTFQEAAKKSGFLDSDEQWFKCLEEACLLITNPEELRNFFVVVIENCQPSDIKSLWNSFKKDLSRDILKKYQDSTKDYSKDFNEEVYNTGLLYINQILLQSSKNVDSLIDILTFDKTKVLNFENIYHSLSLNRLINEELDYDSEKLKIEYQLNFNKFNCDQKKIFKTITNRLENQKIGKKLSYFKKKTIKILYFKKAKMFIL